MFKRNRRLRENYAIRSLVRETILTPNDFVFPIFVVEGENIKEEICSLPNTFHYSIDKLEGVIREVLECGVKAVLLFGLPEHKDEVASSAFHEDGIVQRAIKKVKELAPDLLVITDVCMCQYTSHGHCGIVEDGRILNDESIKYAGKIAVSHAVAGADMVAPSDMMDGMVRAIRNTLDENNFTHISIMSYSAKYSSSFYGPFREAACSAPQFGDRKTYQMDPANVREALKELQSDYNEGADILMVKPALPYLDVLRIGKDSFNLPMAAYQVSGEYSMIKAGAQLGYINEKAIAMESLLSIKRAGADIIITYYALDACRWLREENC